jgi:AcrR family transcriptional regulator
MLKRKTRAEQATENRERVLAAARKIFLAKGYNTASIDEIAEEAGFSKGVVYSQFGSKADLFFALLERRIEERAAMNMAAVTEGSYQEATRSIWAMAERVRRADESWTLLVLEFRIHAARDPELRYRYAELHHRTIAGLISVLEHVLAKAPEAPAFPLEDIARLAAAIGSGYALEEATDHEGWSTEPGEAIFQNLWKIPAESGAIDAQERRP